MRRRELRPARPITPDDEWDAMARRESADEMLRWMKGSMDLSRKFKTLKRDEADNMAGAVIARWIVLATERIKADPAGTAQTSNLLMGS